MASFVQDPTDPTGIRDLTPKGNSEVIRARTRKAHEAMDLKLAGWTWEDIAEVSGYPTGRACQVAAEAALEAELLTESSQKLLRKMDAKRLERLLQAVWAKAINPECPDQFAAVKAAREIIVDHRKLLGLDAPQQFVVTSPTAADLERWVGTVLEKQTPELLEADIFAGEVVEGETVTQDA